MILLRRRDELIAELEPFADHHERFQYVIDRAKAAPALPAALTSTTFATTLSAPAFPTSFPHQQTDDPHPPPVSLSLARTITGA